MTWQEVLDLEANWRAAAEPELDFESDDFFFEEETAEEARQRMSDQEAAADREWAERREAR